MKSELNRLDIIAVRIELQKILNARVKQIYDIDNKTYLIKLNAADTSKVTLLFEAGIRIHTTQRDWPENDTPSRFTRKLREYIRNKRIVKVEQLGVDRILDIQFGSGESAYHLILELFKRGNIFLTDHEYSIVSLLCTDPESLHYATREKYPVDRARQRTRVSLEDIESLLISCKKNEPLWKAILPCIDFGESFLEHCLSRVGLDPELKVPGPSFVKTIRDKLVQLVDQLAIGNAIIEEMQKNGPKGYISMLVVDRDKDGVEINKMFDFNPYPFAQSAAFLTKSFDSFMEAVDDYFSLFGGQKLESKHVKKENEEMRMVNIFKSTQASRLPELSEKQLADKIKADLIMSNANTVEQALNRMRCFLAGQMTGDFIEGIIEAAKKKGDPICSLITKTKFEINTISMLLSDPIAETKEGGVRVEVDLDLNLSAHANAERYYDPKKHATVKEKRTLESLKGALKSAEEEPREVVETVNPRRIPQNENEEMRMVNIFKSTQASRLPELSEKQLADKIKADLIMSNAHTVEQALNRMRCFLAGQMTGDFIEGIIEAAKKKGDPICSLITKTKFEINTISMLLSDPFAETKEGAVRVEVDLDLTLSAHANAERYDDPKNHAAVKEKITHESLKGALKSTEEEPREVVETVNPRRIPQNENEAMRMVNIFKSTQASRLPEKQLTDKIKAGLIMSNEHTVEQALNRMRSFLAGQMSADFIEGIIEAAKKKGDPICSLITKTKFEINIISMLLSDPFEETKEGGVRVEVDLDLSLSAHANAERYYDPKKHAVVKEKITVESLKEALKSVEEEAREVVKTVDPRRIPQNENEAMRIKTDQASRLHKLSKKPLADKIKGDLITKNAHTVEQALNRMRSFFAVQMPSDVIQDIIEESKKKGDPIVSLITKTKFEINTISMILSDPFAETKEGGVRVEVDLDLSLSAHANAERYYDHKKLAAVKEKRIPESQKEALKSAEEEARELVKAVDTQKAIAVARKVPFWFEKFFWFVTSDNCLVIGGRDQKQNELIVKHYMNPGDLYVQAEVSGASRVVIKNPEGTPVPFRTIFEAGQMALCYSQAWEWQVLRHVWWVYAHQISKSAPTGEYHATGSFIIRGPKNYIPPIYLLLQLGFSFLFKIDESSASRHGDERKAKVRFELPPAGSVPGEVEEELEVEEQLRTVLEKAVGQDVSTATGVERETAITDLRFVYSDPSKTGIGREAGKIGLHSGYTEATAMDGRGIKTESHSDSTESSDIDRENIQTESHSDYKETTEDETEGEAYQMEPGFDSTETSETEIQREGGRTQFSNSGFPEARSPASSPVPPSNTLAPVSSPERSSPSPEKPSTSQQPHTSHQLESQDFVHSHRLRTEIESSTPVLRALQEALISSTAETKEKKTDVKKMGSVKEKDKGKFKKWLKSKLKKVKDKFRDPDKEEKELKMDILQSAGLSGSGRDLTSRGSPEKSGERGPQGGGGETGEEMEVQTELDMLSVLTGQPHPEDQLHYALPLVAPYSALHNHKFKVKLVPGMSDRGTAARSALEHFSQWQECGQVERDLIRAVPDQLLSRNFPDKVKLLFIQDKK